MARTSTHGSFPLTPLQIHQSAVTVVDICVNDISCKLFTGGDCGCNRADMKGEAMLPIKQFFVFF